MKRKVAVGLANIFAGVFLSVEAFAQDPEAVINTPVYNYDPGFFMAILGGLLLALGFQFVLTNLSVAAGVTAIGNINKKKRTDSVSDRDTHEEDHKKKKSSTNYGVLFTSAAGVWGMITAAISLFFASMLAVKLSLIPGNGLGIALGLMIWAGFFMVVLYLESKAISSVMGGIFSAAYNAIKAGFSGIGSMFSPSESARMDKTIDHAITKLKDEVAVMVPDFSIKEEVEDYLHKLKPHELDTANLKEEIKDLLTQIRIETRETDIPGEKEMFLKIAEKEPKFSKKDVNNLSKAYDWAKTALKISGAVGGVGAVAALMTKTPPAQKLREEVEDYLKRTSEPELHPDILKAELEEIFKNPSSAIDIVKNKVNNFDKETVVSVVAARQGVDREEALKVADKVEDAINKVKDKVQSNIDLVESKTRDMKDRAMNAVTSKKDEILTNIQSKFEEYFSRIDRSELDYGRLMLDLKIIMKNPALAPKVLRAKLRELDSESLVALLSASDRFSKAEAENIAIKYEEAKIKAMLAVEKAEMQVGKAKDFALQQAENTRETAMAASWWLFATLVVSGVAAALGGMAAI